MIRPRTFRGPRARAARAAQTAESSPPESPRRAWPQPHRRNSSRMKATRTFSTNGALIFSATDDPFERPPDGFRPLVAPEQPLAAGRSQLGQIAAADDEVRLGRGPAGHEPSAGGEDERAAGEGHAVLAAGPVGVKDEGGRKVRDRLAHELPHPAGLEGVAAGDAPAGGRRDADDRVRARGVMDVARAVLEEVAADEKTHPAERRLEGPEVAARGEDLGFLEDPGGRQEDLAVDVEDAAVGDERRRVVEQAPFGRALLDEADDRREALRGRGEPAEPRVGGRVEGHLLDQVLERVAGQPELREADELDLLFPGLFKDFEMG